MQKVTNSPSTCPEVNITLQVIGGKWKPLILWHIFQEPIRFGMLKKNIPPITQKMLTQQLRELEKDRIIIRTIYAEIPPKVEYSISNHGKTLLPLLKQMFLWGEMHRQKENHVTINA